MPKKLHECVSKVKSKGVKNAYAVCNAAMHKGDKRRTKKGK